MRKFLVMACVLSLVVAALALVGCGSGGGTSGASSPEKVTQAFWIASMTGNAATSWSLLSKELQSRLKTEGAWAKSGVTNSLGKGTIEVGKAKINGDTATVTMKVMLNGAEITSEDVTLVKENGAWKIQLP